MAGYPGMKTVRIQDRPAQVYRGDLCVVGSGAGGLSAALEAVRLGQTVVIVDAAPQLGGQAVGAALGTICGLFRNGPVPKRLTHGVMDGLFEAMFAQGDAALRRVRGTFILDYVPNAWMRWAERQIAQTGIVPLPAPSSGGSNTGTGSSRRLHSAPGSATPGSRPTASSTRPAMPCCPGWRSRNCANRKSRCSVP